jgi:hypothetical protein
MKINSEDLAYWFFRLNGFLTIPNFVVHQERRGQNGTDVDILGVRFPYRAELFESPMTDYCEFRKITSRPYIAIAEVKTRNCALNGPWTNQECKNMTRVLRAIGMLPLEDVDNAASMLYKFGYFKTTEYYISLICVGEIKSSEVEKGYPLVPQILWSDIKKFIFERFKSYRNQKSYHPQWDENGQNLWDLYDKNRVDRETFCNSIELIS